MKKPIYIMTKASPKLLINSIDLYDNICVSALQISNFINT